MKRWDINTLVGHWPFRYIRKNTLEDLIRLHTAHGITGGFVASLDSVFYNDPLEGDRSLARMLEGSGYQMVATVNPKLPALEENVEEAVRLGAKAVRIYPSYHGYTLEDADFVRLCRILEARNIPLFLCMRMEDERLEYLIRPGVISLIPLEWLAKQMPGLRIVLLNVRQNELEGISSWLPSVSNVFFDTSGLKNNSFAIEKALRRFGSEHVVFGSQWPMNCFTSTWLKIEQAQCSETEKDRFYANITKLL